MLYRFYKGNSPYVIILIIITGIIFWIPGFFQERESMLPFDYLRMPLFNYVHNLLGTDMLSKLIALSMIVLAGFYLNRLNSLFGFLKERTQLPALIFVVINSSFIFLLRLTPALFAGILFLFFLEKVLFSYRKENLSYNFFEASFILSIATFFYMPAMFLWPVIFAGLMILRPVIWREWVLSFMGLILPFLLFFALQFIRLGEIQSSINLLIDQFSIIQISLDWDIPNMVFIAWLLVLILFGSGMILRTLANRKIFSRKTMLYLFWIFVFSIGSYGLIDNANAELILFSSIPVSFLISEYFLLLRSKRWKEILFTVFILTGLVSVYLPLIFE
jgi:hypothetical protein